MDPHRGVHHLCSDRILVHFGCLSSLVTHTGSARVYFSRQDAKTAKFCRLSWGRHLTRYLQASRWSSRASTTSRTVPVSSFLLAVLAPRREFAPFRPQMAR